MDYCGPETSESLKMRLNMRLSLQVRFVDIFDLPLEIRKVELRKGSVSHLKRNSFNLYTRNGRLLPMINLLCSQRMQWQSSETARLLGIDRTNGFEENKSLGLQ
jgi:hypothetical protein